MALPIIVLNYTTTPQDRPVIIPLLESTNVLGILRLQTG